MIFDQLTNINRYDIDLEFVTQFLENLSFQPGKIEIGGEDHFAIGLSYPTSNSENGVWEAHRKYLDIHYILEGEETVLINDIEAMVSTKEYEDDCELFAGEKLHEVHLKPGDFLILFPNEVHKTGIMCNEISSQIKKLVFKKLLIH
ncbi:YhcH/YjgK/YiaL family protein [Chryseobacterium sp. SSA4.19]|uniref:YhcH/YjgK/YiaL family protein n=1 Tax=Chryseobacterium sp. SSA4.19 TaxID=2919915 RepID=UPI001F4DB98D|nr:YhcH/YjgK/YiaL family protein [Chryseobacterium sp. SSA4.19]MCJ8152359.1 YhcH/YjgK/YiaL family protein [Chryseobacterium sp. SSA4.19]